MCGAQSCVLFVYLRWCPHPRLARAARGGRSIGSMGIVPPAAAGLGSEPAHSVPESWPKPPPLAPNITSRRAVRALEPARPRLDPRRSAAQFQETLFY